MSLEWIETASHETTILVYWFDWGGGYDSRQAQDADGSYEEAKSRFEAEELMPGTWSPPWTRSIKLSASCKALLA
jgi:hypothetical protein